MRKPKTSACGSCTITGRTLTSTKDLANLQTKDCIRQEQRLRNQLSDTLSEITIQKPKVLDPKPDFSDNTKYADDIYGVT